MNVKLFLLDPGIIFLNHGSFGACPREVFAVYQQWQMEMERRPVEFLGRRSGDLLEQARERLAEYLGTDANNLVFITNTTAGINTIARSLSLAPGDEILTTDHEYGACDNAWDFISRQTGATYVKVHIPLPYPGDEEFLRILWRGVTPKTRIVYLSHITSSAALFFPVAEVCRKAREMGIFSIIDGAHAPGQIPLRLDELGADLYAGNLHKWFCAPKGAAFLYARPEIQSLLHGLAISWGYSTEISGHTSFDAYTGKTPFIRRHQWQGTRDLSAFLSAPAAIDFQEKHQWNKVRRECNALLRDTEERFIRMTGLPSITSTSDPAVGQMRAIPLPPCDPELLKATLYDRFHIEVPITGFENWNFVRLSIQQYNTPDDVDALVLAIREIFRL